MELSVSSSGFDVHKTNFGYVIEGSSPENSVIGIVMHLKPNSVNGFVRYNSFGDFHVRREEDD